MENQRTESRRPDDPREMLLADGGASRRHGDEELTRDILSGEAARLRDGLGLPIRLLPMPREGTCEALREYSLSLNRLISGQVSNPRVWSLLEQHLPDCGAAFAPLQKSRFHPLWTRRELAEGLGNDVPQLLAEWRRRIELHPQSALASSVLNEGNEFYETWRGLTVGDFDVSGRGKDYTTGMEYFQAARSFGIECLLDLLGGLTHGGDGVYLDVLGGDGYILRILEASRKLREKHLLVLRATRLSFDAEMSSAAVESLLADIAGEVEGALLLVLSARGPQAWEGRLLALTGNQMRASDVFSITAPELFSLIGERTVSWLGDRPPMTGLAAILTSARAFFSGRSVPVKETLMVTNDVSPHMFRSAGLWGVPVREDARKLSRTLKEDAFDGVVFAYGTHHVAEIGAAVHEAFRVLRPGGRIVVHDFLDEGQVGRWFHEVVDKHSRTGHDFAHLGPIQLAVYLLVAGFRGVELYEMEDPFVFSVPEGSGADARDVACTYLLGMYGMAESFGGQRERFERLIAEILTYPEIGNLPHFASDLVYVPRRAVVVSGQKPRDRREPLSAEDAELVERLDELLRAPQEDVLARVSVKPEVAGCWFGADGRRWGLSVADQEEWRRWLDERDRSPLSTVSREEAK